jgi:hypothetical protein
MNIEIINKRINEEICYKTLEKIDDKNLLNEYKQSKSLKKAIEKLDKILEENDIEKEKKIKVINDYIIKINTSRN